ncbi:SOS response-associated peptidase family protein (plasmid) [Polymorphobacter sp. PAMC 29334]|nr:SOS response-associated peptidase family protein [Polymorphobacter sp. PAMC 29334]
MCNLYRMTSTFEAMRRLFAVEGVATNLPAYPEIYPNREGPIIRSAPTGERVVDRALWGVPAPVAGARPVTNVRNLTSSFWRSALTNPANRCLVPVTAFAEWTAEPDPVTARKRKVWFEVIDAEMFVFAGIVRRTAEGEADRYAFLTCAPNTIVGAIHPKAMPVILHGAAIDAWLTGDAAAALALPMADELMRVIPDAHEFRTFKAF